MADHAHDDLDAPDPGDHTMLRLEVTEALERAAPGMLRGLADLSQRKGTTLGGLDDATPPAGTPLDTAVDAAAPRPLGMPTVRGFALAWDLPELPGEWARGASNGFAYQLDAALHTAAVDQEDGVRRWMLLTADGTPVMLSGDGGRPWLVREDHIYDVEHDIEGGWTIWARPRTDER